MDHDRHILNTSTGAKLEVWRQRGLFHAIREDAGEEPQICLGVDLFEVIAELAGLDLERQSQAREANTLAKQAQLALA